MNSRPDDARWFLPGLGIVTAITATRLVLLAFNKTDLFVDEAQYWLWGQTFEFGYYSKPPLIAWVIGGMTALMGDEPFWVRAPFSVFHGATALVLGALAARTHGTNMAVWVVVAYATLPMVAVGSLLASTDTIMAPFFCAALYFHRRVIEGADVRFAILAGAAAGVAFLAKYAAIYFLLGVCLAAVWPAMRMSWPHASALLAAFGLMILPNVIWNLNHDLTTVSHTIDNVGWVHETAPFAGSSLARAGEFLASQFAVMGPLLFAALIWGAISGRVTGLWPFVIPALLIVTLQAFLEKAYANWAASSYFAGTLIAVAVLLAKPRLLSVAIAVNVAVCGMVAVLPIFPETRLGRDALLLDRYLGRADLSRQIISVARAHGNVAVVSDSRDVLADLFYTGADAGLAFYAPPLKARPMHHYAQTYPLPASVNGPVLFVTAASLTCPSEPIEEVPLRTDGGNYAQYGLKAYIVDAGCLAQ
jgi:4-amino-4-deoxy-L-arabinose transferase-like glycosyltransferase